MFRSELRWTEQGEKPTRYFFNMEAKNFNRKTITELETNEGVKITGHKQLLQEIENFSRIYANQNMLVHMNSSQTLSLLATSCAE